MRGAPFVLGVVFVVLKLCGVIAWSWWLVTLPFWIGLALFLAFAVIGLFLGGVSAVLAVRQDRKTYRDFRRPF